MTTKNSSPYHIGIVLIFVAVLLHHLKNGITKAAPVDHRNETMDINVEDDRAFWDVGNGNWSGGNNSSMPRVTHSRESLLSRIPGNCKISPLEFDCGNGLCIPIKKWRDCHSDCPMGVDEECWANQTRCDGCKCVDPGDELIMCRRYKI